MVYFRKYQVYWVKIFQVWCAASTTHCDSGDDVTIVTYSLSDLYVPKMKIALFFAPESNSLSCACIV